MLYVDGVLDVKLLGSGMRASSANALGSMVKFGSGMYVLSCDHASPNSVGLFRLNEPVNELVGVPNSDSGSTVPVTTRPRLDSGSAAPRLKKP